MLRSIPLDERHQLGAFDSCETRLDDWLREQAVTVEVRRMSRTFVWTDQDDDNAVAYYSLASHVIARGDLASVLSHKDRKRLRPTIPAVLLGKLALSRTLHGQGFGGVLLADALGRAVAAGRQAAAHCVVVDALNEDVVGYYANYGFSRIPGSLRMVQTMDSIEASLTTAGPRASHAPVAEA